MKLPTAASCEVNPKKEFTRITKQFFCFFNKIQKKFIFFGILSRTVPKDLLKIGNYRKDMNKTNFFDYLIICGALLILVWSILKAAGLINSPVWLDMVPYFGGGISILGGAYKLGKIKKGIEDTNEKVTKLIKIEERFSKLENEHNLAMSRKLKFSHI